MTAAEVAERLAEVRERIAAAARRVGRRPEEIALVGVAKRQPAESVVAAVRAGLLDVGENYVQEAAAKRAAVEAALAGAGVPLPRWHLIGRLQRNKARQAVRGFDVVQTLDRAELGAALEARCAAEPRRLRVLLQVDVSGEPQKGGVAPDALPALVARCRDWPHLEPVGLMAIPAVVEAPEQARPAFARLRTLRDALVREPGGGTLRELSMGMSSDFEVAVEEGATLVRVGVAIFGPRSR
jgi:pyridoxal phosphate enzyme (YggS family)